MDAGKGGDVNDAPVEKRNPLQRLRRAMTSQTNEDGVRRQRKGSFSGGSGPSNGVFPDPDSVKEAVRDFLEQKKYNVHDFYKTEGFCQQVARSSIFDHITLFMIIFNAVWIAVDTDNNDAALLIHALPVFQAMENVFCVYFTMELIIRYMSFRRSWDAFRDFWFVFDTVIVVFMIFETWIITILLAAFEGFMLQNSPILGLVRLLRLFRMTRVVRVLKAVPELMILLKGMLAAMRSVLVTLGLLMIVTYVYAIAFTALSKEYQFAQTYFRDVPASMFTCIVRGALLDEVSALLDDVGRESGAVVALFLSYVLIAAVTVMNLLIGVLCEVVGLVATVEREELQISFVQAQLEKMVAAVDLDGNGMISQHEMKMILQSKEGVRALHSVGVDPVSLVDLADVLFPLREGQHEEERQEMSFSQFMRELLLLRGQNTATAALLWVIISREPHSISQVKDMITLRKVLKAQQEDMLQAVHKLESSVLQALGSNPPKEAALPRFSKGKEVLGPWLPDERTAPIRPSMPRFTATDVGKSLEDDLSQKMQELRDLLDTLLPRQDKPSPSGQLECPEHKVLRSAGIGEHSEAQVQVTQVTPVLSKEISSSRLSERGHEDLADLTSASGDLPGMEELEALEKVLSCKPVQDIKVDASKRLPGSLAEDRAD
ncbi:unnamed protein product [Effrenium voratum]|nr:unnamed protein product [Effrenium voratum]